MAPAGHVYSMPFKWVSQSRSCLLTQWIEYIFKYANGIFEIIWDTLLLLQISCSKYLHQSRYPRYDVNYLKILLGSLYPNVIQIFALKYIKISPSLPTWKFVSECYTNNCFKIYKNISFIANLEVYIRMLYKYLL